MNDCEGLERVASALEQKSTIERRRSYENDQNL